MTIQGAPAAPPLKHVTSLAGRIDIAFDTLPTYLPHIRAGRVRAIAVTLPERVEWLPEVPTVSESGFSGFEAYAWWGVFAPAGTPKPMIERFGAEMTACLREERVARQLTETQQVSLLLGGPEHLRKFVAEQMQVWGGVARENNIKGDA